MGFSQDNTIFLTDKRCIQQAGVAISAWNLMSNNPQAAMLRIDDGAISSANVATVILWAMLFVASARGLPAIERLMGMRLVVVAVPRRLRPTPAG